MQEETSFDYVCLSLQVIPLILKVYDVTPIEWEVPETNRQVQWYLDKIERLDDTFPIPVKFHLPSNDVPKDVFRYTLKLTFRPSQPSFPFSLKFSDLYDDLVSKGMETGEIKVFWFLFSPEPMSKYQIETLLKQYGEVYAPVCHPLYVGFELVGALRGV